MLEMIVENEEQELERDGAACREVMHKPNVELLQKDLERTREALRAISESYRKARREIEELLAEKSRLEEHKKLIKALEQEVQARDAEIERLHRRLYDAEERVDGMKEMHRETVWAFIHQDEWRMY